MKKWLIIVGVSVVALVVIGYVVVGVMVYNRLTDVAPHCDNDPVEYANTPAAFTLSEGVDPTPYLMPDYQEVSFPSRDDHLNIAAWWIAGAGAADTTTTPTVILVHGLGGCRRSPSILLAAGMLHRNGFNTLLIDLRDQGDSQIEDGRYAGGTEEYRDVLGAWDWLVSDQGVAPEQIGLFGTSLGAATALIAMGEEPRVAATWEDSSYADLHVAAQAELARNGYPTVLADSAVWIGKLISGDDLGSLSPLGAIAKLNGRPVYITHGAADTRLSVQYAYDLADAIRAQGGTVEPWIVPGADHVRAIFLQPQEYESRLAAFFETYLGANPA